jgi:hypothetical protein
MPPEQKSLQGAKIWIYRLKSVLQQESVWDPKEYADSFDF